MRVTGGRLTGRKIDFAPGISDIRPSMDRMRESLFGCLGDLEGLSFLDLFSGTGVIALEAFSRGASPVECVEKDHSKSPCLIRNLGLSNGSIRYHFMPVELFIKRNKVPFDIVFLDPPFPYQYKNQLLSSLAGSPSLKPNSLVLIHYPKEDHLSDTVHGLRLDRLKGYGRSMVGFYRLGGET